MRVVFRREFILLLLAVAVSLLGSPQAGAGEWRVDYAQALAAEADRVSRQLREKYPNYVGG